MSKLKSGEKESWPQPIREISQIVAAVESEYGSLGEANLGSTPFDADARFATIRLLAIVAEELSRIRVAIEKSAPKSRPAPRTIPDGLRPRL
jgi:hypothetical protein